MVHSQPQWVRCGAVGGEEFGGVVGGSTLGMRERWREVCESASLAGNCVIREGRPEDEMAVKGSGGSDVVCCFESLEKLV